MKNLLPIADPTQFIDAEGNIIIPVYASGSPRNYRLNGSKGQLNINGKQDITKPGESFKVLPIAFRILNGELFTTPHKRWCEVYFINAAGHLSMFMFHSYSLENLETAFNEHLFYEGSNYCEAVWTVTFQKKVNKDNASYCLAFFDFTPLTAEEKKTAALVTESLKDNDIKVFRRDTLDFKTEQSINWNVEKVTPKVSEPVAKTTAKAKPAKKNLKKAEAVPA